MQIVVRSKRVALISFAVNLEAFKLHEMSITWLSKASQVRNQISGLMYAILGLISKLQT